MKVLVRSSVCRGHSEGECLAPDVFRVDERGYRRFSLIRARNSGRNSRSPHTPAPEARLPSSTDPTPRLERDALLDVAAPLSAIRAGASDPETRDSHETFDPSALTAASMPSSSRSCDLRISSNSSTRDLAIRPDSAHRPRCCWTLTNALGVGPVQMSTHVRSGADLGEHAHTYLQTEPAVPFSLAIDAGFRRDLDPRTSKTRTSPDRE